jgi:hypothetical protein
MGKKIVKFFLITIRYVAYSLGTLDTLRSVSWLNRNYTMMDLENKIALVTGSARGIGARIFTEVIGQPFSYEARPPKEFYRNVLAAGAEPSYMKCVFDSYTDFHRRENYPLR